MRGIELVRRSIKTLGGIIGCDENAVISHIKDKVNSYQPLFDILTHPKMPPQAANGLLRICASNKFNYLARIHPPRLTHDAAKDFDARRIEVFNNISHINPPLPRSFINDHVFDSVLGFRLATNYIIPAYYSAAAVAAHSNPSLFEHSPDNMPPHIQHFRDAWQYLVNQGLPADTELPVKANGEPTANCLATLPIDFMSIPEFYDRVLSADDPTKIQRSLSKALKAQRKEYVTNNSDAKTVARLNSLQAKEAMAWYYSFPSSPQTTFTAAQWQEAIKFITHSPLDPTITTCLCGHDLSNDDNSPIHFNTCPKFRKTYVNNRHNDVVNTTTRQANAVGIVAVSEYNHPGLTRTRPDGLQYFDEGPNQSDVTIWQPDAPSHLRYCHTPGLLLSRAEHLKHAKYDALAAREGCTFRALAMEAYGAMGKEFLKHIAQIAKHAAIHNSYIALGSSPIALMRRFIAEISAAQMKGNANIRLKASQQSQAHTKHPTFQTNSYAHALHSNAQSLYLSSFSPFFSPPQKSLSPSLSSLSSPSSVSSLSSSSLPTSSSLSSSSSLFSSSSSSSSLLS